MDWAQILIVILSLLLAILLLAAIALVVMPIRVTHQIRQVTTAAQHAVSTFSRSASRTQMIKAVTFAGRHISKIVVRIKKHKERKGR